MNWIEYITLAGGGIAFLVGLFKWIDVRKREEETKRFEQFHRIFEWVAGRTAEGKDLVNTQQAIAVYELGNFPEYSSLSIPILEYYLTQTQGESDDSLFRKALIESLKKLKA